MRKLITNVRQSTPDEPLIEVDAVGLGAALAEVVGLWGTGKKCSPEAHVEKTKAVNEAGDTVGFNYYLVEGEHRVLGPMRSEPA